MTIVSAVEAFQDCLESKEWDILGDSKTTIDEYTHKLLKLILWRNLHPTKDYYQIS